MEPLKITITLRTPMVDPEHPIHLDGLLGALRVRQAMREIGQHIDPRHYHHDIPVERFTSSDDGRWCFKASVFRFANRQSLGTWMQTSRINIAAAAKHRDEGWLLLRAAKPNPAGGPFKNSLYHEPIIWATLEAYCVGNRAGIERLLRACRQIGGRRGVGFGQVHEILIEPIDAADCQWCKRALPLSAETELKDLARTHIQEIGGLHAPYWDRRLHQSVWMPYQI